LYGLPGKLYSRQSGSGGRYDLTFTGNERKDKTGPPFGNVYHRPPALAKTFDRLSTLSESAEREGFNVSLEV
jgi:hypothetical protein